VRFGQVGVASAAAVASLLLLTLKEYLHRSRAASRPPTSTRR
jgi:hypothetical protein